MKARCRKATARVKGSRRNRGSVAEDIRGASCLVIVVATRSHGRRGPVLKRVSPIGGSRDTLRHCLRVAAAESSTPPGVYHQTAIAPRFQRGSASNARPGIHSGISPPLTAALPQAANACCDYIQTCNVAAPLFVVAACCSAANACRSTLIRRSRVQIPPVPTSPSKDGVRAVAQWSEHRKRLASTRRGTATEFERAQT